MYPLKNDFSSFYFQPTYTQYGRYSAEPVNIWGKQLQKPAEEKNDFSSTLLKLGLLALGVYGITKGRKYFNSNFVNKLKNKINNIIGKVKQNLPKVTPEKTSNSTISPVNKETSKAAIQKSKSELLTQNASNASRTSVSTKSAGTVSKETSGLSANANAESVVTQKNTNASDLKAAVSLKNANPKKVTVNGNTRIVEEPLELLSKDGKKHHATLIKKETISDGLFGKRKEYTYTIKDTQGRRIAECDGMIEKIDGELVMKGHGIQSFRRGLGLGSQLKSIIKQSAIENGCKSINIEAAYGSHMFHNKMGYKVNFVDDLTVHYNVNVGKSLLQNIKNSGKLPELNDKINNVIKNGSTKDVNALFDEIFSLANSKGLRSENIGIIGICVPMKYVI